MDIVIGKNRRDNNLDINSRRRKKNCWGYSKIESENY